MAICTNVKLGMTEVLSKKILLSAKCLIHVKPSTFIFRPFFSPPYGATAQRWPWPPHS